MSAGVLAEPVIVDARVDWCDDFDNAPSIEVLVEGYPDGDQWRDLIYRRYPINSQQSISDEQQAIVGGRIPNEPTPGWHAYIAQFGPLLTMKTWGGRPDRGAAGGKINLACEDCDGTGLDPTDGDDCPTCNGAGHVPFVIRGGWHPGAATARAAGLEAINASVFITEQAWERGHTAHAGFALLEPCREALAEHHPEIIWEYQREPRWFGQPSKYEWRSMERDRIETERLWWAAQHGGIDYWSSAWFPDWGRGGGKMPWDSIRNYSELGPAGFDRHGRVADVQMRADWLAEDERQINAIKDQPPQDNDDDDSKEPF